MTLTAADAAISAATAAIAAASVTVIPAVTSEAEAEGEPAAAASSSASEFCCKHVLFCLIKVLKVPKDHNLCYQSSLTDSELNLVLDGQLGQGQDGTGENSNGTQRGFLRKGGGNKPVTTTSDTTEAGDVRRQALCEDQEET